MNNAGAISNARGDCFDTRKSEIEFEVTRTCSHKSTASKGNHFLLLQEITDHKEDHSAVPVSEGTVHGANG
jgi:hypothetical protein